MKKLNSDQLRKAYLDFFRERGHAVIPTASLVPENDPTVLFTTAGMHPLVPYLLGEKHPAGKRLTDVQICVRPGDIDERRDAAHCTLLGTPGQGTEISLWFSCDSHALVRGEIRSDGFRTVSCTFVSFTMS